MDDDALAGAQGPGLFAEREKQILVEAPVEEHADARIDGNDSQRGEFADLGERLLRRRHQPVLGVAVDEDLDVAAHLGARGNEAAGEQDFAEGAAIEIKTRGRAAQDAKEIQFSEESHERGSLRRSASDGEPNLTPAAGFAAKRAARGRLDGVGRAAPFGDMAAATDQNFQDYKRAEAKALEIMRAMKATTPRTVDVELALLVAIFELHKATLPGATIAKIVKGHLDVLENHYARPAAPPAG